MTKLQEKMALAKKRIKDNRSGVKLTGIPENRKKALAIAYAYEEVLSKYIHKPFLRYVNKLPRGSSNSYLVKAAEMADEFNIDYIEFIKAHFYWMHIWFNRAPYIRELCSEGKEYIYIDENGRKKTKKPKCPARWRVTEYLKLKENGELKDNIQSPVIPSKKIDPKVIDKINRLRLEELMETYDLSEEETFSQFALSGYFDGSWVKKHPLFKKLNMKSKL